MSLLPASGEKVAEGWMRGRAEPQKVRIDAPSLAPALSP